MVRCAETVAVLLLCVYLLSTLQLLKCWVSRRGMEGHPKVVDRFRRSRHSLAYSVPSSSHLSHASGRSGNSCVCVGSRSIAYRSRFVKRFSTSFGVVRKTRFHGRGMRVTSFVPFAFLTRTTQHCSHPQSLADVKDSDRQRREKRCTGSGGKVPGEEATLP